MGASKEGSSVSMNATGSLIVVGAPENQVNAGATILFKDGIFSDFFQSSPNSSEYNEGSNVVISADGLRIFSTSRGMPVGGVGPVDYTGGMFFYEYDVEAKTWSTGKVVQPPGISPSSGLGISLANSRDTNTIVTTNSPELGQEFGAWIFQ